MLNPMTDTTREPRVQVNVRLPTSVRDRIDARRHTKGLSRDEWMLRAVLYALDTTTDVGLRITGTKPEKAP